MVIETEIDARGVRTLWLSREDVHNAMNAEMMDAITALAADLKPGGETRVLVLAGRGKSFCAGGDLGWMRAQFEADSATRAVEARRLADMLYALHRLDIPVISRVHGNCFGGGVGLTCIADAAVGVRGKLLGLTETRLGIIPATIGPYVHARMGPRLNEVFMSSRRFEAEEAVRLGILSKAVDEADLDAAIEAEVTPYLACAPGAVSEAKALARRFGPTIDAALIEATMEALTTRWESQEAADGVSAFFDKRPPPWAL
ncbi:MAG: crotonase/enoyl-CoA hydratase family protein [Pseudomonadota bacterium]